MPLKAVLFDFDGVIADTENIHVAAWQRTLAAFGWEMADEVCARSMEIDDRVFLAEVFAKRKLKGDVEGWVRRKQELTVALLTDSPRVFPGFVPLVEALHGRCRLGVVSTTWRENIVAVLAAAGVSEAFETIVGKEDVAFPKPDPEGYRLAVERLSVKASDAVALEDSETGLNAARAAGISTIVIGHRHRRADWVGAATYVDDLSDTSEMLRILGAS
jgi:HAD superfamily hydrolase (TIGR01509 family)